MTHGSILVHVCSGYSYNWNGPFQPALAALPAVDVSSLSGLSGIAQNVLRPFPISSCYAARMDRRAPLPW